MSGRGYDTTTAFGPILTPNGTLFRLWAPGAEAIDLELATGVRLAMAPRAGGWFEAEAPVGPGALYRFRLKDGTAVPDPASRAQAGDVHGFSIVADPGAYRWRTAWAGRPWHEAVILEVHAGLCGGFKGVAERIPAWAALGITAVELMPVAAFPGTRNWGYDGVLPFAPAAIYGTPEELKALIDTAHAHGVMMLLDVVYNHFGPDGNYLGLYAPDFFHPEKTTPWGPAVAFDRPEVSRFFLENALMWIEDFRFDGLRLDAVHAILPPQALAALGHAIRARLPADRPVHLVLENEHNDAALLPRPFDAQWNDDIHHCLHVLLTGEGEAYYGDFADAPARRLARCLSEGFAYQGEAAPNLGRPRGTPSAHLRPTAFVAFAQNHDQIGNRAFGERLLALADADGVRAALALVLLAPQIPMLFMGEEMGARTPFLFFTDHAEGLADLVREGRRAEFDRFSAFSDPARRATIPDPNAQATFTTSIPVPPPDADEWRDFVEDMIAARHTHVVPRLAGAASLGALAVSDHAVVARWRMGDGAVLTLAANFGGETCPADLPAALHLLVSSGAVEDFAIPPRATLAFLEGAPA
ncbi:maltooligosyltrehalose trehalohydrolase [Xanthobacter flavus]|uniref:Malto-oligosyltrehalose trehalohydrolase n=1 Tax=Xanthobacter flavus TaxID=281 RepID=A0A9W6CP61_XANFL|nr:malto-oligosyltrehalose trehalohydrolase [Xanthobacter flavus]MDR6335815.1 maltooligosyltrehalose trehalohydrolase [Xanthobacter flavus]GLI24304.1 malto-oligosyltrehalose trehalohydrolase [Xanthobacter flavus]